MALVPALAALDEGARAALIERARYLAFQRRPALGVWTLLGPIIAGFLGFCALAAIFGWFREPDGFAALGLAATVAASLVLMDWLRARAIAPELRRLLVNPSTNGPDDGPAR